MMASANFGKYVDILYECTLLGTRKAGTGQDISAAR